MAERPRGTTLPGTYTTTVAIPSIALGTSGEQVVWTNKLGATVRITAVTYTPEAAVTGNTTNNLTLQLRNKGLLGSSTTAVTAVKTYATGTDLTAFLADALVISTTAANLDIDVNETVALNKAETGSGLILPEGVVTLEYQYR